MNTRLTLLGIALFTATSAFAVVVATPVQKLVPTAEIVVVGTLEQGEDRDGLHRGVIVIEKVLLGKDLKPGAKLEVRWDPRPKNLEPTVAHLAHYTFAPKLKKKSVFVIQPRKEKESSKAHVLGWGTQYPEEDEEKIRKLVGE